MKSSNHSTDHATRAWLKCLDQLLIEGRPVAPRGQATLELLQHTLVLDMRHPVVVAPTRKVSSKFLGGEAYWILSGDDLVSTIAPYNKNITAFSDDGYRFFGAYGPKVVSQLAYVVKKLLADRDTRQAGLTIWRENPPETKDVPCTVAMFFNIRDNLLNCHVFMRSSDIWLGVPYDVFNFSMIAHRVCAGYNSCRHGAVLEPGDLYLTAASRHVYTQNERAARQTLSNDAEWASTEPTPVELFTDREALFTALDRLRRGEPGSKWWES